MKYCLGQFNIYESKIMSHKKKKSLYKCNIVFFVITEQHGFCTFIRFDFGEFLKNLKDRSAVNVALLYD